MHFSRKTPIMKINQAVLTFIDNNISLPKSFSGSVIVSARHSECSEGSPMNGTMPYSKDPSSQAQDDERMTKAPLCNAQRFLYTTKMVHIFFFHLIHGFIEFN